MHTGHHTDNGKSFTPSCGHPVFLAGAHRALCVVGKQGMCKRPGFPCRVHTGHHHALRSDRGFVTVHTGHQFSNGDKHLSYCDRVFGPVHTGYHGVGDEHFTCTAASGF